MAAKARGANFDSNHGYWILTDKEYQDSQAKDAQIEELVKLLRRTWHQIQADNQDRSVQLACRAGLGVSEWRNLMPNIWFEIDAAITGLEATIKETTP